MFSIQEKQIKTRLAIIQSMNITDDIMEKLRAVDFRFFIGCQCYIAHSSKPVLLKIEGIDMFLNVVICDQVKYDPNLILPVLRSFDSLTRNEVEELNKLWPKTNINRTIDDSIKLDAEITNYLTLLHVDVFGWIKKDLAIDAARNTLLNK